MLVLRRSRSAAALPLSLLGLVVVAACGGAVDNSDLYSKGGGQTASSGGAPTATATATATPPSAPTTTPQVPPPTPAAKCGVSFSTDVMQVFVHTGCTANGCHKGNFNDPPMDASSPSSTYKSLTNFTLSNGKPYVAVGNTNPKASMIFCNLRNQCGAGMPIGGKLDSTQLDVIDTWLACGAPFN